MLILFLNFNYNDKFIINHLNTRKAFRMKINQGKLSKQTLSQDQT